MKNSPLSYRKAVSSVFYTKESYDSDQCVPGTGISSANSVSDNSRKQLIDTRHRFSLDSRLSVKFEGFVRKRQELLVGKKKSRDLGWHVRWVVVVGNILKFYLIKYLNSAVNDEQPLPTKKPPIEALDLVGQVILSGCHVGETPEEIQEQKGPSVLRL